VSRCVEGVVVAIAPTKSERRSVVIEIILP
jgi:hypothetical protein